MEIYCMKKKGKKQLSHICRFNTPTIIKPSESQFLKDMRFSLMWSLFFHLVQCVTCQYRKELLSLFFS